MATPKWDKEDWTENWVELERLVSIGVKEDGDRITVRSDEEMKAMLSYVSILLMRTFLKTLL